jgi:uroporphyrinogen-III synthase
LPEHTPARTILVTRPEPGGAETARRISVRIDFTPLLTPLQTVVQQPAHLPAPERIGAILFTSRHAITPVPSAYHPIPVFAVGAATARRAEAAGFTQVHSAQGDAESLTRIVAASLHPDRDSLVLVTGRGHGMALVQRLRDGGFRVSRRVVYATRAARILPQTARAALMGPDPVAVMLFSAGAARIFLTLIRRAGLTPHLARHDAIVISQAVAREVMDPGQSDGYGHSETVAWRRILIASSPDQDAMLALTR